MSFKFTTNGYPGKQAMHVLVNIRRGFINTFSTAGNPQKQSVAGQRRDSDLIESGPVFARDEKTSVTFIPGDAVKHVGLL